MKRTMSFKEACETVEDAKKFGSNEYHRRIVNWFRRAHGETAIRAAKEAMDIYPEDAKEILNLMTMER